VNTFVKLFLSAWVLIGVLFVYLILNGFFKIIFLFFIIAILVLLLLFSEVRNILLKTICDLVREQNPR
jgi:hypothetical protein